MYRSCLSWWCPPVARKDTSTGQIVAQHRTRMGPCDCMRQNPWNAIMQLGHANGVVSLWSPSLGTPLVKMLCHKARRASLDNDFLACVLLHPRLHICLPYLVQGTPYIHMRPLDAAVVPTLYLVKTAEKGRPCMLFTAHHLSSADWCPRDGVLICRALCGRLRRT